MSRTSANLLLLLAGAIWGMGFVAQSTAMDDIGPMAFTGLRALLAGLVILPFALRERNRMGALTSRQTWKGFLFIGCVFFLGNALQQAGLLVTTVTNAGFLTALYVILVPLFLLVFLRERPVLLIWPAAILAFSGIFLLSGGKLATLTWGDWLVIMSACFWALHVILIGRLGVSSGRPFTMVCTQFFVCGALGMVAHYALTAMPAAALALEERVLTWQVIQPALLEIVYAGAFSSGLAFTLQAVAQRYTSASSAAILLSSESLFAALFAAWLLSESIAPIGYVGCAMIFVAILMVELAPARKPTAA